MALGKATDGEFMTNPFEHVFQISYELFLFVLYCKNTIHNKQKYKGADPKSDQTQS